MWRKTAYALSGLVLAGAVAYGLSSIDIRSNSTNFDLRWLYPSAKADREPVRQLQPSDYVVMAFNVPSANTTIVARGPTLSRVEESFARVEFSSVQVPRIRVRTIPVSPVRTVPNEDRQDTKDKRKLMVGCEPAFSPVTMPSLAHISARCDA